MLSLSRPSGFACSSTRVNRTPATTRAHVRRRATCRPVAAAKSATPPQSAGPACKSLLSLPDSSWKSLMDLISPRAPAANDAQPIHRYYRHQQEDAYEQLVKTVQNDLECTVEIAHPMLLAKAAGAGSASQVLRTLLILSSQCITVVLKVPEPVLSNHSKHVQLLQSIVSRPTAAIGGAILPTVLRKGACVYYQTGKTNLRFVFCGSKPAGVLNLLDPSLSSAQREVLSSSTALASITFVQQQPALYHTAVKVVKLWVGKQHQWTHQSRQANMTADYLIDLLVLKAFQDYQTSVAALQEQVPDDAAALDAVLTNFLQLVADLPKQGVISWEYLYNKDTALQVVAHPDLAKVLRPDGFESHPIVLDPVDPTTNVAVALTSEDLQAFSAAAKDASAKCSTAVQALIVQRTVQQVPGIQEQLAAMRLHQRILLIHRGNFSPALPLKECLSADLGGPSQQRPACRLAVESVAPFKVDFMPIPFETLSRCEGDGDAELLGVELRLDASNPIVKVMYDLDLPIPITLLEGSSITFVPGPDQMPLSDKETQSSSPRCVELEEEISGVLGVESGVKWMLSRDHLFRLGLCRGDGVGRRSDLEVLQRHAQAACKLQYKLRIAFGN